MFAPRLIPLLFGWLLGSLALAAQVPAPAAIAPREHLPLDAGWRFAFGNPNDTAKDFGHASGYFSYLAKTGFGDGPAAPSFDDRSWRLLDVPHDWAVELPFDGKASHSHGYKTLGPHFPDTSVGWYRRHFAIAETDLGRRISIEFDGVYRNARVFVNGFFVGEEPSGYAPASYDITDYLNYGGDNVISVRVDATMEEGWFYEGAGIYRHVWLSKTAPLHVAQYGTSVRTEVAANSANISVETTLINADRASSAYTVSHEITDATGQIVARAELPVATLAAGATDLRDVTLAIAKPQLWSLDSPYLYKLVTTVLLDGRAVDRTVTSFGVRTIRFDPNAGFLLNGQRVTIKGTNNHQDHAGVGVALPDALQDFRVRQLKAMGSNTYRTSHHPPTPELLDACDRVGLLVIDENRLMGINDYHLGQLERMIRRDRNHPSVILWSIGNEEWGIEGNIRGARIATTMQDFARRLDPTRLTTAAISGGWGGISSTIDVAGANYIKQANLDQQHRDYPRQVILGTEETTTQATRGVYFDDKTRAHLAPVKNGTSGGNAELGWQYYVARPHFAGVVYWTGFDYRGESNPFSFPAVSSQFGILDTCGFPKDGFYYLQSWWTDTPVLHIFPHWNWFGHEGKTITVTVNSNADEVELLLNGASLGRKPVVKNDHLEWTVSYQPGTLLARSYTQGKLVRETKRETTGAPAALTLAADRTTLTSNGTDVAVLTVSAVDAQGRSVPDAGNSVTFTLTGPGRIIGVGNGDPSSHEPDQFLPGLVRVEVTSWREKIVSDSDVATLTASRLNTSAWPVAFAKDTKDKPSANKTIVYRGTLDVPALATGAKSCLLLGYFGENQTVYLDGKLISTTIGTDTPLPQVELSSAQLTTGRHQLAVVATPFAKPEAYENLAQQKLATLRIDTPAPTWRRQLFNGLAQVIIQTDDRPGEIVLRAQSAGLADAKLTLTTQPPP